MNIYELNIVRNSEIIPTGIKARAKKLSHVEDYFNRFIKDIKETCIITIKAYTND